LADWSSGTDVEDEVVEPEVTAQRPLKGETLVMLSLAVPQNAAFDRRAGWKA
jgi:hypothetical protein